jgi:hypothetical protein
MCAGSSMTEALTCLAPYDRNWPSERHRLVSVAQDGAVTVVNEEG